MKLKHLVCCASAVLFAVTACLVPQQAAAAKYELKLAHSNPEKDYSHLHSPLAVFKDEVERRTGGNVTVTLYPNGTLGTQKAMLEQAIRGVIQAVALSEGGIAPFYPEIAALSIPYLFQEVNIAYEVFDGPLGQSLMDGMAKKTGLRPLAWGEDAGFRHFTTSKKEIKTPEDLKGLKIRTMPIPAHLEMVKALGGSPTPVAWSELYTALQTGVVEGQENPICNIRIARLYEVQKYLTLDGHLYSFYSIFVNDKWLQDLPAEYRLAVVESGRIAAMLTRCLSRVNESIDLDFLKKNGMVVYVPTESEKAEFKKRAQEPVIKVLKETLDPALIDRVLMETAKAEKKLGYSE
jgi:C4-dicarboxylate-binding protein DctP